MVVNGEGDMVFLSSFGTTELMTEIVYGGGGVFSRSELTIDPPISGGEHPPNCTVLGKAFAQGICRCRRGRDPKGPPQHL